MSRIEFIAGARWARETCEKAGLLLSTGQGVQTLLPILRRGLECKPKSYADGVQEIIDLLQDAADVRALKEKV